MPFNRCANNSMISAFPSRDGPKIGALDRARRKKKRTLSGARTWSTQLLRGLFTRQERFAQPEPISRARWVLGSSVIGGSAPAPAGASPERGPTPADPSGSGGFADSPRVGRLRGLAGGGRRR